jgi:anti-sigma regulatory factor (Ser/Thr protein kinase)
MLLQVAGRQSVLPSHWRRPQPGLKRCLHLLRVIPGETQKRGVMTPARILHMPSFRGETALDEAVRPRARDRARMSRLRLHLSATPEEIPFARAAITRLCEHLEIADEVAERIRLAITEACSNCVLHAYDDGDGTATYVLDARVEQRALRVVVSDRGAGVPNARPNVLSSLGFGLRLIRELADSSDVSARPGGGTRVVMRFVLRP